MAELIDKTNLFNNLFVRNGKVCPNNDIDNFPTTIDVKEVKKAILKQPTTTEAEIKAKAIDEFAEKFIYKVHCEGCSGCTNCYETGTQDNCDTYRYFAEAAEELKTEQLKGE